jgi:hypothetical protein
MRPQGRLTVRLASLVGAGLTTGALLLVPVPVEAQEGPVTVEPRAEAWYRTVPGAPDGAPSACDLPTGCGPAVPKPPVPPPSVYPSGTLHVGVAAGTEESRSYLTLDLSAVPAGAELVGGTLRLPIASDPNSGTAAPDLAKVRVCDVPTFVRDGADGDLTGAPKVDCATSSLATFVEGQGDKPGEFLVDLTPFVGKWSNGGASIAVLPDKGLAPSDSWHVAFSRHDRKAEGAKPISAQLMLAGDEPSGGELFPPLDPGNVNGGPAPAPDLNDSAAPPPLDGGSSPLEADAGAVDPLDPVAAPAADPGAAAPQVQPVAVFVGHKYPAAFLLPLVVGLSIAWTGRAFTRDLRPASV